MSITILLVVFFSLYGGLLAFAFWPDDGQTRYSETRQLFRRKALEGIRGAGRSIAYILGIHRRRRRRR